MLFMIYLISPTKNCDLQFTRSRSTYNIILLLFRCDKWLMIQNLFTSILLLEILSSCAITQGGAQ